MSTRVIAPLSLDDVSFVGSRLARPECVLCTRAGDVFASDRRGGVSHIGPEGGTSVRRRHARSVGAAHPNGIALDRDGSFLVAHLVGRRRRAFSALPRRPRLVPVLRQVDGVDLHVTNFVLLDAQGRIWVTISTRQCPRINSFRPGVADGYIVLIDDRGARIVADGLGFANECRIDPSGNWLYVNETYARRADAVSPGCRWVVRHSGNLSRSSGPAIFPTAWPSMSRVGCG